MEVMKINYVKKKQHETNIFQRAITFLIIELLTSFKKENVALEEDFPPQVNRLRLDYYPKVNRP